jgi:RNA polymerase sigma-70 factor, ECF subfamily
MSAVATSIDLPEEEQLSVARAGDQAAFGRIVREHQSMVFSIALHSTGHRGVAEEIAQDVFLQLYRNLGAIESAAHLRAWLRRTTSHRCIDHIRRQPGRIVPIDELELSTETRPHDPLLYETLRKLVETLPEQQRLTLILRYQEEMEMPEISRTLEIPLGTVKSHLHRAVASLRTRLAGVVRRGEGSSGGTA